MYTSDFKPAFVTFYCVQCMYVNCCSNIKHINNQSCEPNTTHADILCQVCVAQLITTYKRLVRWCLMFQHKKATSIVPCEH